MSIEQELQVFLDERKHEVDWGVVAKIVRDLTEYPPYSFIDQRSKRVVEVEVK